MAGRPHEILRLVSGAFSLCAVVGASALAASDTLDGAISLHRDGRLAEALAAYQKVIAETLSSEAIDLARLAHAYHNACYVLVDLAEPAKALGYCGIALELRRDLGDRRGVARTLGNLGVTLQHLGRYDEAAAAYREALELNERRGDVAAQVRIRSNLGVLAMQAGRYGDAIDFHGSAESLAEEHGNEPWSRHQVRIARLNLGAVLEKLGAYRESLGLLRALAAEDDDHDSEFEALVQINLGVIYRNLGDPVRAVDSFEDAARTYEALGDTAGLSNAKLNLALALHLNLRRLDEAERAYGDALAYARAARDRSEEIQDLFYRGNLELELERLDEAEVSFRQCLELAKGSDSPEGCWSGLYGLGRVRELGGDLDGALSLYRRAIAEIEQVRSSLADAGMRSGYFGDKRPVYAATVRVLARLHAEEPGAGHHREALAVVQRAKARELLEALGAGRPAAPGLIAATSWLDEDEALLEYFLGDDHLYFFILRGGDARLVDLGPAGPVLRQVEQVYEDLSSGRRPPPARLARLSRILLHGGAALEGAARLRIAPDGKLYHLPFEILAAPGEPDEILLDRLEISYLPSASTLGPLLRRRDAASAATGVLELVGFANPELPFDPEKPRAPGSLIVSRYGLDPLPAAEREMEVVSRLLAGEQQVRLGREATEEAFRGLASRGSRVMHLATHTVVDNRPGQGAVILLAASAEHDGALYPEEIAALDYRVQLTVLASCWSAMGTTEEGRALASLTDAFLAAGSSAVVATLWEVDDAGTATFMEQFYHQLSRGLTAAEALRLAKLRLRETPGWDQPRLWSAYVLIGEAGTVADRSAGVRSPGLFRLPAWAWILTALLLGAGLLIARRR